MGFRFRKSVKLGPFRVTFSKSGVSYSAGVKGLRVTKTASGAVRTTASIPGTGISYSKQTKSKPAEHRPAQNPAAAVQSLPSFARYDGPLPPFGPEYDKLIEDAARLVIGAGFAILLFCAGLRAARESARLGAALLRALKETLLGKGAAA